MTSKKPLTYPMTPAEFGEIRRALGDTQGQLATRLFMARTYVNELENGRRPITTHVAMLMAFFGSGAQLPPPKRPKRTRAAQ